MQVSKSPMNDAGQAMSMRLPAVGANGFWGNVLTDNGRRKNTQGLAIATGFLAGTVESLVVVPFELVKIRLQSKGSTFKGPLDVMRHSYQTHGIFG